jgi:hypothetical protein
MAGMVLLMVFAVALGLSSCASKPLKLSGGWGPNASVEYGGGDTKTLPDLLFGSSDAPSGKPPPGVVVIAAGDGTRVDAHIQAGAPPVSTTATITNNSPPGVSALLRDWLSDDKKPDDKEPEK